VGNLDYEFVVESSCLWQVSNGISSAIDSVRVRIAVLHIGMVVLAAIAALK
jgi:hypothetical protein